MGRSNLSSYKKETESMSSNDRTGFEMIELGYAKVKKYRKWYDTFILMEFVSRTKQSGSLHPDFHRIMVF
jgi:hypothetical protein